MARQKDKTPVGGELEITLHRQQARALKCPATEILFGGAAGGGKSHFLRAALITFCMSVPGLQCYLFRRTYPDLVRNHMTGPGAFPEMLAPLTKSGNGQIVRGEIRFPNGSKIHLRHLQNYQDVFSYQGAEFHVLCCEVSERVRMADGSTKRVDSLKHGDMVATLQGPRRVTHVNNPRRIQAATMEVRRASGQLVGRQTHGITHAVLTPDGWKSYDDRSGESLLFSTSEPTGIRSFSRSGKPSSRQPQPIEQFPVGQSLDPEPARGFVPTDLGRRSRPVTSAETAQELQETGFGSSEREDQGRPPLSSVRRFPVVLASRWLPSIQEGQLQHGAPRDGWQDVESVSRPEGCNVDCRGEHDSGDEHLLCESVNGQAPAPSQGDVVGRIPSDSHSDDAGKVPSRSHSGRSYAHPYTGDEVQAEEATEIGWAVERSCGEKWVIDITIEDANHYITESGLVNKNCFDEATHFTLAEYQYLRARCRLGGLKIPAGCQWLFPRILLGSNPGNIGHVWVKAGFVDHGPYVIHRASKEDGGMLRCFIPSRIEDNPTLMENDPDYIDRLEGLGDPALVRALKEGDWDVVAGAIFGDVWRRDRHTCDPFPIPQDWDIWVGADDGFVDPTVFIWLTQDPRTGTFYAIDEFWKSGCLPAKVSSEVKEIQAELIRAPRQRGGETELEKGPVTGLMDSAAFADTGQAEISRGDQMKRLGLKIRPVDKWPGSRKDRAQNLHRLLAENPKCPHKLPALRVFKGRCPNLIRTLPILPRDEKKPEQVGDHPDDHGFDALTYGLQWKKSGIIKTKVTGL